MTARQHYRKHPGRKLPPVCGFCGVKGCKGGCEQEAQDRAQRRADYEKLLERLRQQGGAA